MRGLVLNVHRVNQSDQHVDVEQIGDHGVSSCNCFTSSGVTGGVPWRVGSSGTPLQTRLWEEGALVASLAAPAQR